MSQYDEQYTPLEMLGYLREQLEKSEEDYGELGVFDRKRPLSALWHKTKNFLRIGKIEDIDEIIAMIKSPRIKDNEIKLKRVVDRLLSLVDRDIPASEMHKHHATLMVSAILHELVQYPKSLPTGLVKKVKEVLDRRYQDLNLGNIFQNNYRHLAETLRRSPRLLDNIFFSDVSDQATAVKQLEQTGRLVMLRDSSKKTLGIITVSIAIPYFEDSEHKRIDTTLDTFLDMKNDAKKNHKLKYSYEHRDYVLSKESDSYTWQDYTEQEPALPPSPSIKSNTELLRDEKIETAAFALLHASLAPAKVGSMVYHTLFRGIGVKDRFEEHCNKANQKPEERESQSKSWLPSFK